MQTKPTDDTPAPVMATSKQAGACPAPAGERVPAGWTARMLTALDQGVKGGRWFSLMDKVWQPATLAAAWQRVSANGGAPGVDQQTIARFGRHLEQELTSLATALREDRYCPHGVRRVYSPKPGSQERRPLGIPTVRDRVVQAALRQVIEPIFEARFAPSSYGFRPGRGCKDALREVDRWLKAGHLYVVDVDLRKYFDTIPHEPLMARVAEQVADGRVLALIRQFLTQGIMEEGRHTTASAGTPQGGVISPLLAKLAKVPCAARPAPPGAGLPGGALCRRPGHPLPHPRPSRGGAGPAQSLGDERRADAAPGKDPHRRYDGTGSLFRLPRLPVQAHEKAGTAHPLPPAQKPGQATGDRPLAHPPAKWLRPRDHHPADQPGATRLVHVLPTRQGQRLSTPRRLDPPAPEIDLAPALRTTRTRTWRRPSTLARRLLCGPWAVLDDHRPRCCASIRSTVTPRLESRMRENRPSGSEGGGPDNRPSLPYLVRKLR